MVCSKYTSANGICISYFLLAISCLFPLQSVAKTINETEQQIELAMQQLLHSEMQQWQQQAGLKQLDFKLQIKVPSGAKRLPLCLSPLTFDSASGLPIGNVQRKVSCSDQGWNLYVRASVDVTATIPVANRVLKRGAVISAVDIEWRSVQLGMSDRDLVTQSQQIIGQQVLRKIRRYKAIKVVQLSSPQWVNIGDRVIIEASSNGFYANMQGEALEAGGEGQAIRVRNLSSGKVIVAYPLAPGRVATKF
ncbi:flagellar basal body P-ring formation protein FlgA [Shewanella sp. 1CM18E]|uniref:flagellar basal body P-ring formation chaperone FlgA n=1 Tax=Shewanella sp. 1CM18E TaxID=2929169 RepID=UPI00202B312C|nr:flagellar basal body P-ring formation chaperone FlgA [Shewanella sp. 1CM18E]MCK8046318.1 flagellar basal body P-ring formation protein FlgA [Shewanella sp. 1CM18E]